MKGQKMNALIEAGIVDLGGTGDLSLEIEYNSAAGFKEAFYRLPAEVGCIDIVFATIVHSITHSILSIEFDGMEPFDIKLDGVCEELIEVRSVDSNITHMFNKQAHLG